MRLGSWRASGIAHPRDPGPLPVANAIGRRWSLRIGLLSLTSDMLGWKADSCLLSRSGSSASPVKLEETFLRFPG